MMPSPRSAVRLASTFATLLTRLRSKKLSRLSRASSASKFTSLSTAAASNAGIRARSSLTRTGRRSFKSTSRPASLSLGEFGPSADDSIGQTNLRLNRSDTAKHMLDTRKDGDDRGKIINIASLVSFQGGMTVPAYAAAKHGILGMTKGMSNDFAGRGINVNASVSLRIGTRAARKVTQADHTCNSLPCQLLPVTFPPK